MALFRNLFSQNTSGPSGPSAETVLEEIRLLSRKNPSRALKELKKVGRKRYRDFGFKGKFRTDFFKLHGELEGLSGEMASCFLLRWSRWNVPTTGALIEAAGMIREELIYLCGDPDTRRAPSAVDDSAALHFMATESDCPLILLGEEDLLVRRRFLLEIGSLVDPMAEDVIQDLLDAAQRLGLKVWQL